MMLGDKQANSIEAISTGSLGLDVALGIGGFPAVVSSRSMGPNLPV